MISVMDAGTLANLKVGTTVSLTADLDVLLNVFLLDQRCRVIRKKTFFLGDIFGWFVTHIGTDGQRKEFLWVLDFEANGLRIFELLPGAAPDCQSSWVLSLWRSAELEVFNRKVAIAFGTAFEQLRLLRAGDESAPYMRFSTVNLAGSVING